MCPTCHQVLAYSQSSIATNIRTHLHTWCAAGWTSGRVKDRLIAQFGNEILASPPKSGFDLLAWVIPAAALAGGVAVASALALRWRGRRGPPAAAAEHRRRDRRPHRRRPGGPRMREAAVAFSAGLLSFATPCVLPLVPAYLGAIGARSTDPRRALLAALPVRARLLGGVHRPRSRGGPGGRGAHRPPRRS